MAFTQLQLYNGALLLCGERFLSSTSEDREPRRLLDQIWNSNGKNFCLEQAQWWFAMRAVVIDYDPAITPTFGHRYAFTIPSDWISTSAVCSDEYFRTPITSYAFEVTNWYADVTPIYVKYVSNDALYGGNLNGWPASFCDYVCAYFAGRIIKKLAGDRVSQETFLFGPPGRPEEGYIQKTLHLAKSHSAFTQPTMFIAQGQWTRARRGSRGSYYDRGNRNSLIG